MHCTSVHKYNTFITMLNSARANIPQALVPYRFSTNVFPIDNDFLYPSLLWCGTSSFVFIFILSFGGPGRKNATKSRYSISGIGYNSEGHIINKILIRTLATRPSRTTNNANRTILSPREDDRGSAKEFIRIYLVFGEF